jgi:hypothetical protein
LIISTPDPLEFPKLEQFRQNFNRSISTVDVSNLSGTATSGPMTAPVSEMNKAISQEMQNLRKDLAEIVDGMKKLNGEKAVN